MKCKQFLYITIIHDNNKCHVLAYDRNNLNNKY